MQHRITPLNAAPLRDRQYVLYWMIAFRRANYNFALERAANLARELKKPLLVYEPLQHDYQWNCDRFHQFVIDGMHENARRFKAAGVGYVADLNPTRGFSNIVKHACAVVTDDYPCFFLPHVVQAAAKKFDVQLEMVDSNGLFPMRATDRQFKTAASFRRFLDNRAPDPAPLANPLVNLPPMQRNEPPKVDLVKLPINHAIGPTELTGGTRAAEVVLGRFRRWREGRYEDERNVPDEEVTSGLSPYLHFGHISAHQVAEKCESPAFLDQLRVWREIGFNMCALRQDYDQYESLPEWAQKTLNKHAGDYREHSYSLEEFDAAATHDELWNAAQRQLVREGRIHNYLRMVWGKKILEWSESPREALAIMIELNNKYALDGRDPNSYSGIFWILGRYDRAWGPERQIFGKIRYMSCANTYRKTRVREYVEKYA